VDNLLDSARLATGGVHPQLRAVGYDDVLARALATLDAGQLITVEIDEAVPPVLADPGLLERVVANLVANALTHGRAHGVVAAAAVCGATAQLRIRDRGPGLPADRVEAMFAPFQRLGDRDATSGVGLGLAVARGFTEAMGGTLGAEATPGGGLTMTVTLPIDPAVRGRAGRRGRGARPVTHVLVVVDDDAHILRTLRIHLAGQGYSVATAETGRDAIRIAASDRPVWWSSTSGSPTSTGPRLSRHCAATRRCPSSCCRPAPTHRTRSTRSTPARTTTSPSRSASPSCSPGCGPPCAAARSTPTRHRMGRTRS
jgi:CheY-like chemotaxis protein